MDFFVSGKVVEGLEPSSGSGIKSEHNTQIGQLTEMQFITIFQNGGFTKVWFSLKTVLFPVTLTALVWFWRRIMQLSRPANLLERTLFSLGVILSIMNCPIEWITLWVDAPFMLLLNDIREGAFYAMLLCFWLIFAGEHMMDQVERNKLSGLLETSACVIFFIISQISEGQWKWGDEGIFMEYSSAFLTGVYGMWNMYTIALLSLYAPSHKTTASAGKYQALQLQPFKVLTKTASCFPESLDGTREEEVQLTQIPSESTAFTSIISKSTID
nr:hypothetical protein BaRGS_034998 [Batillaria attramentaria]